MELFAEFEVYVEALETKYMLGFWNKMEYDCSNQT